MGLLIFCYFTVGVWGCWNKSPRSKGPVWNRVEAEFIVSLSSSHGLVIRNLWVIRWGKSGPLRERKSIA